MVKRLEGEKVELNRVIQDLKARVTGLYLLKQGVWRGNILVWNTVVILSVNYMVLNITS